MILAKTVIGILGNRTVVQVVYSDESKAEYGLHGPLTVVAAIMLNMDSQWHPVRNDIEAAVIRSNITKKPTTYTIKGRTLYHQVTNGKVEAGKLIKLLMLIARRHMLPIFCGAVDNVGLEKTFGPSFPNAEAIVNGIDPFKIALETCMAKVDQYIHVGFTTEQVLWIHDKGHEGHAKDSLRGFRSLREMQENEFQNEMAGELDHPPLLVSGADVTHIADMIYFGNDEESRALQLADVCCSTITQYLLGNPLAIPYYDILRPWIINEGLPLYRSETTA
jgi:hypothetical protein